MQSQRLVPVGRRFVRLAGRSMAIRVGAPIKWDDISAIRDRKELLRLLERRVFELEAKDL